MNSITATNASAAKGLVMINPRLTIWSGTCKLHRETDLTKIQDDLPPKEIASDGSWFLVDRGVLKGPRALRKTMEREAKALGFPFMGEAIACSPAQAQVYMDQVKEWKARFQQDVDEIVANLGTFYDDQEAKAPDEWKERLRLARLSESEVRSRFRFDVQMFSICEPDPENPDSPINASFQGVIASAVPKLLADVGSEAKEVLEQTFKRDGSIRDKITQTQLKMVARIVKKLDTYSFLDARVMPTVTSLNQVLSTLPRTGPLSQSDISTCVMVLRQLQDAEGMLAHGEALLKGKDSPNHELQTPQGGLELNPASDELEPEQAAVPAGFSTTATPVRKPTFALSI